jgi:hypothetical protein
LALPFIRLFIIVDRCITFFNAIMFFNTRSIFTATLVTLLASGVAARAVPEEMKAFNGDITELLNGHAKRTALAPPTELVPITHPAELTTGQKLKRDTDDNTVFDPSSASIFYWGSIGMLQFTSYSIPVLTPCSWGPHGCRQSEFGESR